MIRYYLSPMVGLGTDEDPRRPVIADLGGINWVAAVGAANMACVLVNAPEVEHARLRADTRSWAFPMQFAPAVEPQGDIMISRKDELMLYHQHPIAAGIIGTLRSRAVSMLGVSLDWIEPTIHTASDVVAALLERIEGRKVDIASLWVSR